MKFSTHVSTSTALLRAADALATLVETHKNSDILLLVSGGSSLTLLNHVRLSAFGRHVTIGMIDERAGVNSKDRNFLRFTKTKLGRYALRRKLILLDPREHFGEPPSRAANRMHVEVTHWLRTHAQGKLFVVLGIGEDAHIAGILPDPQNPARFKKRFLSRTLYTAYRARTASNPFPVRITGTLTLLKKADAVIVFARGGAKRSALRAMVSKRGAVAAAPARFLRTNTPVLVFTDQKAL